MLSLNVLNLIGVYWNPCFNQYNDELIDNIRNNIWLQK